jgi:hypothetical protein
MHHDPCDPDVTMTHHSYVQLGISLKSRAKTASNVLRRCYGDFAEGNRRNKGAVF